MSAIATPSIGSIILTIDRPYEEDGITPRDDLIGVKVWHSTVSGFTPLDVDGNQVVTPTYDGPSLNCVIAPLTGGVEYFVRYALISEIDPSFIDLSDQISCTPNSESGGDPGQDALAVILTSDSHSVPASLAGVVSSYVGSGTDILVYEGVTALTASTSGANGTFSIGTPTVSPAASITVGDRTYSGAAANVAAHSAMSNSVDVVTITYPVVIKTLNGDTVNISKVQTITKAKTGATGDQGPSVVMTSNRALSYTATDGTLDASQGSTLLTVQTSGITSPTYVWTFDGLQTNPTASTTSAQSITQAQFGTSKSATVTCTVNGTYVAQVTIVRLEKSTAAANANNTSIDGDGAIQGVSSGAGTKVSNSNITLSKEGTLSGAGISEQVNLTYIPGTLAADRIVTGTLDVLAKITVGSADQGVVIDGGAHAISVIASDAYDIHIYAATSLAKPANGTTVLPSGWSDVPDPAWGTTFYVCRGKADDAGNIVWYGPWNASSFTIGGTESTGEYNAANKFLFAKSANRYIRPTGAWTQLAPSLSAGEWLWMARMYSGASYTDMDKVNLAKYKYLQYFLVSSESPSYEAVRVGKIDDTHGIVGRDKQGNLRFQLDQEGLYIDPNSSSLAALGATPSFTTLKEGYLSQEFVGATGTAGITTTYILLKTKADIAAAAKAISRRESYTLGNMGGVVNIVTHVVGAHTRFTQTGTSQLITPLTKYFSNLAYISLTDVLTVSADQIITSFTTDGTNMPVTKASVIADPTGSVSGTGVAGVYLRLQSRNMYENYNNANFDNTNWKYAAWQMEF